MKKLLFAVVSALAIAEVAVAADSTLFGVLQVLSSTSNTIVSVPWLASGTGSQDIKVTDIVLTAGLDAAVDGGYIGDELRYYSGGAFQSWRLVENKTTGVKSWEAAKGNPSADDATLKRGQAIMLKRRNPNGPFYIMGKPAEAGATVTLGGGKDVYSLVAPPTVTAESSDVNDSNAMVWSNLTKGDMIAIAQNDGVPKYYAWSKAQQKFVDSATGSSDGITIKRGTGAWFISKADSTTGDKTVQFK